MFNKLLYFAEIFAKRSKITKKSWHQKKKAKKDPRSQMFGFFSLQQHIPPKVFSMAET